MKNCGAFVLGLLLFAIATIPLCEKRSMECIRLETLWPKCFDTGAFSSWIDCLDHESFNYTVENYVVVIAFKTQVDEIPAGA
jgi:hypothetical protein